MLGCWYASRTLDAGYPLIVLKNVSDVPAGVLLQQASASRLASSRSSAMSGSMWGTDRILDSMKQK